MFVIITMFVLCMAFTSDAQVARGYEKIVPGNTVTGFTTSKIAPTTGVLAGKQAIKVQVYVKDNSINYTTDGTIPTQTGGTNVGMVAVAGTTLVITGYHDIETFKCIDSTASSASDLRVTYFFEN